jgi:cobalt-zinc-cadmium efflux system membrane fusion protein
MNRLLTFFTLAALAAACSSEPVADAEPAAAEFMDWNDSAMTAQGVALDSSRTETFSTVIECNGRVEIPPQSKASINAPLGGFVRSIAPYEGDLVRKGQVLLTLEHPDYVRIQESYLEAQSQYEMAKSALERSTNLQAQDAASSREVQQRKAEFGSWSARLQSAKAQLQQLGIDPDVVVRKGIQRSISVRAPFDGYVHDLKATLGGYVRPEDVLMTVEDPSHSHLELHVFGPDVAKLTMGQQLTYRLGSDEQVYSGRIMQVGKAQGAGGSYLVHAHPEGPQPGLRAGQFVRAQIESNPEQLASLPEEALVFYNDQASVLRVEGTKITPVPVDVRYRQNAAIGIAKLEPGSYVVKHAHLLLPVGEAE